MPSILGVRKLFTKSKRDRCPFTSSYRDKYPFISYRDNYPFISYGTSTLSFIYRDKCPSFINTGTSALSFISYRDKSPSFILTGTSALQTFIKGQVPFHSYRDRCPFIHTVTGALSSIQEQVPFHFMLGQVPIHSYRDRCPSIIIQGQVPFFQSYRDKCPFIHTGTGALKFTGTSTLVFISYRDKCPFIHII